MRFERSLLVLGFALVSGCGAEPQPSHGGSQLSQLTRQDHPCKEWDQARVDALTASLPQGFLTQWGGSTLQRVHQALAGIPDAYMSWLYGVRAENGFYIAGRSPGFNGGVTVLDDERPHYIHVYPSENVVNLALQHEVGHALYPHVKRSIGDVAAFDRDLAEVSDREYSNPQLNAYPRSYPRGSWTYRAEFFAEAFNSYYCSPETNAMVQAQFPATFDFLRRYLAAPVWASPEGA